ncbi:MAG: UDP-3-O-acyl-N-acetylglucosamine deacetylase [Bacteroidales bacterium]|nr:UDP-3-O-acyl-N-acetylglucosamine deacetylase [Bacteroidales bacterium]
MNQQTLKRSCSFEGKGLHTGGYAKITILPAAAGTGIVFKRIDLGEDAIVKALAENVSNTARSTTISYGNASVTTIEHLMSALTGMGIDNALIEIDGQEVPILDGSARPYIEAFREAGLEVQDAERIYIPVSETIEYKDEKTGSYVRIEPADKPSFECKVDFNSRVLGVQTASWDESVDYASEVGPCRTFVFFHEIAYLAQMGLVKGGDVENAIVIVEHPVTQEQVDQLCQMLGKESMTVTDSGYLSNLTLHFPDECGRHKLLDLIGDIRLCGGYLNARVTAFKSGHTINTNAAKALRSALNLK